MTGDIVTLRLDFCHGMMCENEWTQSQRVVQENSLAIILHLAHDIVVAQNELKRNASEVLDEFAKYFPFGIVVAVK